MTFSLLAALFAFTIKTSLFDMVGLSAETEASVSEAKSTVVVIASDESPEIALKRAQAFVDELPREWKDEDAVIPLKAERFANRLAAEDAELIKTAEGRKKLAKRAIRRYVASPIPPLFTPEEDPFCLAEHVALSFAASTNALATFELKAETIGNLDRLIEVVSAIRERAKSAKVMITGVPVHTALSAASCKREIGYLSVFSILFIAALALFVFRSIKWIPLFALSLSLSAAGGMAALYFLFDSVHLMTLVFGTTVLGLVIDYSFHALLSVEDRKTLLKNLVISWATTEISFVPLMLSSVAVLRQTAVFLAVALGVALTVVVIWRRK